MTIQVLISGNVQVIVNPLSGTEFGMKISYFDSHVLTLSPETTQGAPPGWSGIAEWIGGEQLCKIELIDPEGVQHRLEVFRDRGSNNMGTFRFRPPQD